MKTSINVKCTANTTAISPLIFNSSNSVLKAGMGNNLFNDTFAPQPCKS